MTLEEINLSNLFNNHQWLKTQKTPSHTIFQKTRDETTVFEIETFLKFTSVIIPIRTGNIQYTTKFANYSDAVEYLSMHLNYYEDL
jgi:hypothetical protein